MRNPDPAAYAFLYDQARESLRRQVAALDELRSRTGTLLGAASLVAAFLGSAASKDGLGFSGGLGVVAFVVLSALSIVMLIPFHGWVFENAIGDLFANFVESDPPLPMVDIHRELSIHAAKHVTQNLSYLENLYLGFQVAAIALILEVVLLLLDIPPGG
jgi:hypothetical protein